MALLVTVPYATGMKAFDLSQRSTIIVSAVVLAALGVSSGAVAADERALLEQARQHFKPLPADMGSPQAPVLPERVALGRLLFFEPRVSLDGTVSCARCHQPALYGTDGLAKAIGVKDRINARNSPTILNAALGAPAHWRGDRESVEDQATKALVGPPSFGQPDFPSAMARLKSIPGYRELFVKAFPGEQDPITPENWGKAIGAYERTLVTPSPFDEYLKGNTSALSPKARAGLSRFMASGCVACHSGVGVGGGGSFQKLGLREDYWKATGSKEVDKGRFDVTKKDSDLYVFKVPGLRNVAMTAPYFHDGSVGSLTEAIRVMGRVQLGKSFTDEEVGEIAAFLESLTGPLPAGFATAPPLPASAGAGK